MIIIREHDCGYAVKTWEIDRSPVCPVCYRFTPNVNMLGTIESSSDLTSMMPILKTFRLHPPELQLISTSTHVIYWTMAPDMALLCSGKCYELYTTFPVLYEDRP